MSTTKIDLNDLTDEQIIQQHKNLVNAEIRRMIASLRKDVISKYFTTEEDFNNCTKASIKNKCLMEYDRELRKLIREINGYNLDPILEVKVSHCGALGTWRLDMTTNRSGHYEQYAG